MKASRSRRPAHPGLRRVRANGCVHFDGRDFQHESLIPFAGKQVYVVGGVPGTCAVYEFRWFRTPTGQLRCAPGQQLAVFGCFAELPSDAPQQGVDA